jgi:hypothetical protein
MACPRARSRAAHQNSVGSHRSSRSNKTRCRASCPKHLDAGHACRCDCPVMQRTFVICCPRSGTTWVQAMLARHSAVRTWLATIFFEPRHGGLERRWTEHGARMPRLKWRHRFGFVNKTAHDRLMTLQRSHAGSTHAWWSTWRYHQMRRGIFQSAGSASYRTRAFPTRQKAARMLDLRVRQ